MSHAFRVVPHHYGEPSLGVRKPFSYDRPVILELAILDIVPGQADAFELAFADARSIIASMPGFIDLQLQRSIEEPNRYVLLVRWRALEDHIEGFRKSPDYQRWKALLHHFYDPFPKVEHYKLTQTVGLE